MILSILLPTFNRSKQICENLEILSDHIRNGKYERDVEIIVSNNRSSDDTASRVLKLIERNSDIEIRYFEQQENIGLENNALFVLSKSRSDFVMYMGDDDYIDYGYLRGCMIRITKDTSLSCIMPSSYPIDKNGVRLSKGRGVGEPIKLFEAGFKNCFKNAWRGHQLSGLVLRRKDIYDEYKKREVGNIYPFVFFTGYCCLVGRSIHYTKYPVKISHINQDEKDWEYGDDGLLNEIFDNYQKLPVNYFQRSLLELRHYYKQSWRLWNYKLNSDSYRSGLVNLFYAFWKIESSKNSTFFFKVLFPFIVIAQFRKNL